jgi:hypothetical protein
VWTIESPNAGATNKIITNVVSKAANCFFIVIPLFGNAVSLGGIGFVSVTNDLSMVAAWYVGGQTTMSASGRKQTFRQDRLKSGI